jgi:fructose-bisphosphate aldolase class II
MPVADYKTYCRMLDNARKGGFAYPAINVTSTNTANAALAGFAEAKSDGIIQVSTGGGEHASGTAVKDMVMGAMSIAQHVHLLAQKYNVFIALHTDHCTSDKLDKFVKPLIAETAKRRKAGQPNLFSSHMFDGGNLPLTENLRIAKELLALCHENEIILEIEAGVVGGEEDGVAHEKSDKLYTTPQDMLQVAREMRSVAGARFMFAACFGNVHGVYKPGDVVLKPTILRDGQAAVEKEFGKEGRFDLVFHGGSGSDIQDIHEAIRYGVVKMNIDTDTQYTFTRPIVDHMMKNYDGVLRIDGEVGNKKVYDPRSYLKAAEQSMAKRIVQACADLKSTGTTMAGK